MLDVGEDVDTLLSNIIRKGGLKGVAPIGLPINGPGTLRDLHLLHPLTQVLGPLVQDGEEEGGVLRCRGAAGAESRKEPAAGCDGGRGACAGWEGWSDGKTL